MGLALVGYEKIKEKQTQIQMETERTRIVNHFMIYHWAGKKADLCYQTSKQSTESDQIAQISPNFECIYVWT